MAYRLMEPRFPLGEIVATPGALGLGVDLKAHLRRHHCGDWGDLDEEGVSGRVAEVVGAFFFEEGFFFVLPLELRGEGAFFGVGEGLMNGTL